MPSFLLGERDCLGLPRIDKLLHTLDFDHRRDGGAR